MDREGTTTDGRAVKVCMKACLFSDGVVAWDLRCVAETFQLKSAEASKQFIKLQLGELSEVMVLMGMGAKREMVIPNHKAAQALGGEDSTLHVQYRLEQRQVFNQDLLLYMLLSTPPAVQKKKRKLVKSIA